ncbi:MAG: hypothetical protein DWQ31_13040 [Planctomycetota bacterium]|nr:MAG: hypothetical protein DWQ31_13040 [Planctomycetota bacterium]REJ95248.1 MAG: hypothetical protein DWQ35_06840 [Planctomycetota bacterium]REK27022.1 MAG: hypothetical protein DWQ42_08155 [Planctomycetota bacterium]REK40321.1 MAG: hypothetical protein DWQ46_16745 [Planctomycetota bacterium]
MEINRNQWFLVGLVLLFIGLQLCYVHSFVLNEDSSRFVNEKFGSNFQNAVIKPLSITGVASPQRIIEPPDWLGWTVVAISAVLVLHALAMPRPS